MSSPVLETTSIPGRKGRPFMHAIAIVALVSMFDLGVAAQEPPGNEPEGTGALLAKINGIVVPLPVVSMDVSLSISGPIVRGRLVQSFDNPTEDPVEADSPSA
jgi:hypothetical protein